MQRLNLVLSIGVPLVLFHVCGAHERHYVRVARHEYVLCIPWCISTPRVYRRTRQGRKKERASDGLCVRDVRETCISRRRHTDWTCSRYSSLFTFALRPSTDLPPRPSSWPCSHAHSRPAPHQPLKDTKIRELSATSAVGPCTCTLIVSDCHAGSWCQLFSNSKSELSIAPSTPPAPWQLAAGGALHLTPSWRRVVGIEKVMRYRQLAMLLSTPPVASAGSCNWASMCSCLPPATFTVTSGFGDAVGHPLHALRTRAARQRVCMSQGPRACIHCTTVPVYTIHRVVEHHTLSTPNAIRATGQVGPGT